MFTVEERRKRHAACTARWSASESGKASRKRYDRSDKGREARARLRLAQGNKRRNERRAPGTKRYAKELVDSANARHKEALAREQHRQTWTIADIHKLELLHQQGLVARAIGLEIGRTTAAVRTRLRHLKYTLGSNA